MGVKKEHKYFISAHWFHLALKICAVILFLLVLLVASYGLRQTMRLFLTDFFKNRPFPAVSSQAEKPAVVSSDLNLEQFSPGSFTELFSSLAWADAGATTAYRDNLTTAISLKPLYTVKERTDLENYISGNRVLSAVGNGKEILLVNSIGEVFLFNNPGAPDTVLSPAASVPLKLELDSGKLRAATAVFDTLKNSWLIVGLGDKKSEAYSIISRSNHLEISESRNLPQFDSPSLSSGNLRLAAACSDGDCLVSASRGSLEGDFLSSKPILLHLPPYPITAQTVSLPSDIYDLSPISVAPSNKNTAKNSDKSNPIFYLATARLLDPKVSSYSAEIDFYTDGRLLGLASLPPIFSSYLGLVHLSYNPENSHILFVYSAYFGQAKEYVLSNGQFKEVGDYGRFLGARVLGGNKNGELAVPLEISPAWSTNVESKNNRKQNLFSDWWLSSGFSARRAMAYRLSGGLGNDLTKDVLGEEDTPGYSILVGDTARGAWCFYYRPDGSLRIFEISDRGFDISRTVSWVSSRLNLNNLKTAVAKISRSDDNSRILSDNSAGFIKYYLTNDDGSHWYSAKTGDLVVFPESSDGIRFRIDLTPGLNSYFSPWVDQSEVEYWLERQ